MQSNKIDNIHRPIFISHLVVNINCTDSPSNTRAGNFPNELAKANIPKLTLLVALINVTIPEGMKGKILNATIKLKASQPDLFCKRVKYLLLMPICLFNL